MDPTVLVENQIEDGGRLVAQLAEDGFEVAVAFWVKSAEEGLWHLYIASPLVSADAVGESYRKVYASLSRVPDAWVSLSEIKLVRADSLAAREAAEIQRRHPGRVPTRTRRPRLGDLAIEEAYIYPPHRPIRVGPRPSVLRFVLRSADDPQAVMGRFLPVGKTLLNRTPWRGKEPRSCGITAIKGRPRAVGSPEPAVYDIEVSYRPKGCITYVGGARYDGWTLVALDRTEGGTLLDGQGQPLPEGHPPVYRRFDVYDDADFNAMDFGEFVGESEAEGVKHVSYEHVMERIRDSARFSASLMASFVAPRRQRPVVKIVLSKDPSGVGVDGFGTHIFNVQKSTPQLQQAILDRVGELVTGFVEGRFSIKNMSNEEFVFVELDDLLVDSAPTEERKASRFNCLREYLPDPYLDELAMRLVATYEVDVSVVDGPKIGLLLKRDDRSQKD
jgi:hypothetical protein